MDILLTQMKLAYYGYDCGMSYLIRTDEGHFVMIDGGIGECGEETLLWEEMCKTAEHPVIDYWFITHPHADHFGGFLRFIKQYEGRFTLGALVHTFPPREVPCSNLTEFSEALQDPLFSVITPQSGDRFSCGGCTFDILFTWRDLPSVDADTNANDCSTVIRLTAGKHRALFFGDTCRPAADLQYKTIPKKEWKCDILQVAHHGYGGASNKLYRRIAPTLVLWPCPEYWLPTIQKWACNRWLTRSRHVRRTVFAGREQFTVNMNKPLDLTSPEPAARYCEKFEKTRIADLGWSFLRGGPMGYGLPKTQLQKGKCTFTTGEKTAVLQVLSPFAFGDAEDFTVSLTGAGDAFGIVYNDAAPAVYEKAKVLWTKGGGEFSISVVTDAAHRTATFTQNGESRQIPYDPRRPRGLYLVFQNSAVTFYSVEMHTGRGE